MFRITWKSLEFFAFATHSIFKILLQTLSKKLLLRFKNKSLCCSLWKNPTLCRTNRENISMVAEILVEEYECDIVYTLGSQWVILRVHNVVTNGNPFQVISPVQCCVIIVQDFDIFIPCPNLFTVLIEAMRRGNHRLFYG